MNSSLLLNLTLVGFLGFTIGFMFRQADSELPKRAAEPKAERPASAMVSAGNEGVAAVAEGAPPRSTETVESALGLDAANDYARIARWLATADEAELAEYWTHYKGGARTVAVTDLLFLNWTRRNPLAAIAAVAGTGDERYAWWAWAGNDAPAALAAAVANGGKAALEQTACGIGEFNPAWLRDHIDEIPEAWRRVALERMMNWPNGEDPLASLDLLKKHGLSGEKFYRDLVRKDPWTAFDWLKENSISSNSFGGDRGVDILVSTLAADDPEALAQLASRIPDGAARRSMENALFDRLLESDPDAALEQARAIESPLVAAQKLGQIGIQCLESDPEKAFGLAAEIVAANPQELNLLQKTLYKNGSSVTNDTGQATALMNALFAKDRERTLTMVNESTPEDASMSSVLYEFAGKWANEDLQGFAEWTNRQDGRLQHAAALQISNQLARQGNFLEAIEWAGQSGQPPDQALTNTLYQWQRADPQAASAWLENSDLTAPQKEGYRRSLEAFKNR